MHPDSLVCLVLFGWTNPALVVIDVSYATARRLRMVDEGVAQVELTVA